MDKRFRLPKKFADNWLNELRNGGHSQGQDELFNNQSYRYCCLGIAGLVCGLDNDQMDRLDVLYPYLCELDDVTIPLELLGEPRDNKLVSNLTQMNDEENKSFSEIADWVENNCELY